MKGSALSLRAELSDTLKLAGPIVLSQVGHMSMGIVDTVVAGHISTVALAALALSVNCFWTFTSICNGCLLALDTYFSQAVGAKDERALGRYFAQSFWSCAIVAVVSTICVLTGMMTYLLLAQPSGVRDAFAIYLRNVIWCLPSLFVFFVLQRYWQARKRVLPFTVMIFAANVLNPAGVSGAGPGLLGLSAIGCSRPCLGNRDQPLRDARCRLVIYLVAFEAGHAQTAATGLGGATAILPVGHSGG